MGDIVEDYIGASFEGLLNITGKKTVEEAVNEVLENRDKYKEILIIGSTNSHYVRLVDGKVNVIIANSGYDGEYYRETIMIIPRTPYAIVAHEKDNIKEYYIFMKDHWIKLAITLN